MVCEDTILKPCRSYVTPLMLGISAFLGFVLIYIKERNRRKQNSARIVAGLMSKLSDQGVSTDTINDLAKAMEMISYTVLQGLPVLDGTFLNADGSANLGGIAANAVFQKALKDANLDAEAITAELCGIFSVVIVPVAEPDATGRKKLLAKYRTRMSMYYKNDGTLDDEEAEALQDEFEGKGITMDEHQRMLKEIKAEYKTATATKPNMDVEPSSAAAPKAKKKKKKKTPKSVGANSVGKRCTVNGYDCKGTIRFVGPHHETGKDRVGVELDEAVGKHSGTVNGNEYFSCGKKCGVLVDAKKVSEC